MSAGPQYEFTAAQNELIGGLAHKMRWVGLYFVVVGALSLIAALLLLVAIYQHKLPADWVSKAPPEVQSQLRNLPPHNQLWGFVLNAGAAGLVYLLIGVWTRSAADSFQQIVKTRGNDISNLMNALGALNKMYGLLYTLLLIALVVLLIAAALSLYSQFMA
jgi:hypothetical protein